MDCAREAISQLRNCTGVPSCECAASQRLSSYVYFYLFYSFINYQKKAGGFKNSRDIRSKWLMIESANIVFWQLDVTKCVRLTRITLNKLLRLMPGLMNTVLGDFGFASLLNISFLGGE